MRRSHHGGVICGVHTAATDSVHLVRSHFLSLTVYDIHAYWREKKIVPVLSSPSGSIEWDLTDPLALIGSELHPTCASGAPRHTSATSFHSIPTRSRALLPIAKLASPCYPSIHPSALSQSPSPTLWSASRRRLRLLRKCCRGSALNTSSQPKAPPPAFSTVPALEVQSAGAAPPSTSTGVASGLAYGGPITCT
ncbi:hypothetical protein VPH35_021346 [Triticum aestivum]